MKRMYVLLFTFLCMNMSAYVWRQIFLLTESPLSDKGPVINPEQVQEEFDPVETVTTWSSFTNMLSYVGDVVFGLFEMIGEVGIFIVAFPYFLRMIGTPFVWEIVLDAIWLFVIGWGVAEWISGREAQK